MLGTGKGTSQASPVEGLSVSPPLEACSALDFWDSMTSPEWLGTPRGFLRESWVTVLLAGGLLRISLPPFHHWAVSVRKEQELWRWSDRLCLLLRQPELLDSLTYEIAQSNQAAGEWN